MSDSKQTLWIRPDFATQFMVLEEGWIGDSKQAFNLTNRGLNKLAEAVENSFQRGEIIKYENREEANSCSVTVETKDGDKILEYKIVKMTEEQLNDIPEFQGW